MAATKRFHVDRGLTVAKSFGSKYVEFDGSASPVKLSLYGRRGLVKVAGVPPEGSGSHCLTIGGGTETFTDPAGSCGNPRRHSGDSVELSKPRSTCSPT
ncbi:hypothetical protein SLINC_8222 [Streptomyces lincolnensis]|uniref:Uncharacterized protein n=1 Tax=Streptomyces lincolnensis TaxID=1915 RepID=A0A1B1MPB4_STRLN|nr:hypothetical protein [Streptomyces lincolnensis]ANS70446.1 hypothetical protein SLINC_8222 [Streptomyces lincolnensis]